MALLFPSLSLIPIAALLILSLWKGVRTGIYSSLALTTALFFIWDSDWLAYPASMVSALVDTLFILMIVFGALLLHQSMEQVGFIDKIKSSLKNVHSDTGFQFYFLAFFLTAFFESIAGFGTPGAIVPLLLVSLGYSPVLSIVAVLLLDGLFAISGAVGTPVTAGFEGPLQMPVADIGFIYWFASIFMAISGCVIVGFIHKFVKDEKPLEKSYAWKIFASMVLPYVMFSFFLGELTGVLSAITMGIFCFTFFFQNRDIEWKPWIPYGVLVIILILPKMIPTLASFIGWELSFESIFSSEVNASIKPLRSPLLPFMIASIVATYLGNMGRPHLKPVFGKTFSVFIVLFPSLAITKLMLNSGNEMPSMVVSMATLFAESGNLYPALSPFIGVIGTFMTGSTTVSNIIFGPVQLNAAINLELSKQVILAMQLTGASFGNAVCLFNIIAAAAVAGVQNYAMILRKNLLPVLIGTLVISALGFLVLAFI